jgi:hypothetical protein
MCSVDVAGRHRHGYVPPDLGVGGGDDGHFAYCLDCGRIQGAFPVPATRIEEGQGDDGIGRESSYRPRPADPAQG